MMKSEQYRVVLFQCICPHYRVRFFQKFAEQVDLILFYGKGEKKGSWQNAKEITGFKHIKLRSLKLGFHLKERSVRLVWFPGLFRRLWCTAPDVVISEGITNILNNVAIWLYCKLFSVPLIIWDGGRQKDKPMRLLRKLIEPINRFLLSQAKAVIAYGTIARDYFISLGVAKEKVFVAQNTIDVEKHLKEARKLKSDPSELNELRRRLGLFGKKVLLYAGTLEKWKKVDELICVFSELKKEISDICLLVIGDGAARQSLEFLAKQKHANDCLFLGKIIDQIGLHFALCDVFVIPGRGGLAINQAVAFGKPVIIGEGDGTEKDLIKQGVNGFVINNKSELKEALGKILNGQIGTEKAAEYNRELIRKFDLEHMVDNFIKAVRYAGNSH